jgi:flagellar biosynthesis/type III secretory pathway chaperone
MNANVHQVAAERLLGLLDEEQQALRGADPERLARISRDKIPALEQLAVVLGDLKRPGVIPPAQRRQLHELVLRCQRQNRANEALLQLRARRVRGALQSLHGLPAHYDGRGRGAYAAPAAGMLRGLA